MSLWSSVVRYNKSIKSKSNMGCTDSKPGGAKRVTFSAANSTSKTATKTATSTATITSLALATKKSAGAQPKLRPRRPWSITNLRPTLRPTLRPSLRQ